VCLLSTLVRLELHRKLGRRLVDGGRRGRTAFVDVLDHLGEIVLDGGHGGDDGRRAEAVSDEREVGKMTLERRIKDVCRTHRAVR